MPASYVKPYVNRGKTDAADAEAICEAVTRPTMRFVPIKTAEQQAVLMLHRTRDLLVRQRTMLVNALRGHMAELGVIAPQGIARVADLVAVLTGEDTANVPVLARQALGGLAAELEALGSRVKEVEAAILAWHKGNEASRRLATIPASGRSRRLRSWPRRKPPVSPPLPIPRSSILPGSSRPGSAWCPSRTATAVGGDRAAFPSRATALYAGCWCWARPR